MNEEIRHSFQERLKDEREKLLAQLASHSAGTVDSGEREVMDRAEEAEHESDVATQHALADSQAQLLEKIDLALRRIGEGTYGMCISCAETIPLSRLEAKPSVSLCVKCQEAKEAQSHRN